MGRPKFQHDDLCHFVVNQKAEVELIILYLGWRKTVASGRLHIIGPGRKAGIWEYKCVSVYPALSEEESVTTSDSKMSVIRGTFAMVHFLS